VRSSGSSCLLSLPFLSLFFLLDSHALSREEGQRTLPGERGLAVFAPPPPPPPPRQVSARELGARRVLAFVMIPLPPLQKNAFIMSTRRHHHMWLLAVRALRAPSVAPRMLRELRPLCAHTFFVLVFLA
jgi:hypothetical protein